MGKLLVGIDLGTTALKIAVFNTAGRMQGSATLEYKIFTPQSYYVESDPAIYMDAIEKGFAKLAAQDIDLMDIEAIGFSCQSETMFFVDEDCKPLRNSISWMDNRAVEQAERLTKKYGNELCYKHTGQISWGANWPLTKALWVKENEPEVFSKTKKILLIEDFIIYQFTGRYVADCAMLTSTLYWDITTKKYWKPMLAELGMTEDNFPEILEPGEVAGVILPEMAKRLNLNPNVKICTGAMDNAIGALGVGACRPGIFSESIGSTLAVCVPTDKIVYDPNNQMPVHYYPIKDTYMMHTFTSGGICLRWFRDNFCQFEMTCAEMTGESDYTLLDKEAIQAPPGSESLSFLPHLNGSLAPDVNPHATGVFMGITLVHKKSHFIRAIMESLGYLVRRNVDALASMGLEVDEIRAFGGGSKSPEWNQINADILQKTVCVTNSKEAACLGAAILAGYATGIFDSIENACDNMIEVVARYKPNPENKAVYDHGYEVYKKMQTDCAELFEVVNKR
ncbi:MAG: xylulokinase [bacterium]